MATMGEYNIHGGFDKFMTKIPEALNDVRDLRSKNGENKVVEYVVPDFQTLEIEVGTRPCIMLEDRHSPASLANLTYLKESILSHKSFEFIRSLEAAYYIAFPDKDYGAKAASRCFKSCIHGPFYNSEVRIKLSQSGLHFSSPSGRLHWDPQASANGSAKSNPSPSVHTGSESNDNTANSPITAPKLRQSDLARILNQPEASTNGHKIAVPTASGAAESRVPKRRKVSSWGGQESQNPGRHGATNTAERYQMRDDPASTHNHVQSPVGVVFQHYRENQSPSAKIVSVNHSPDPFYNTIRSPPQHINPILNGHANGVHPPFYHPKHPSPLPDAPQRMQHHRQLWPKMSAPQQYHHYGPAPVPYAVHQGYIWNYSNGSTGSPMGPPMPAAEHNYMAATPPSTTHTHIGRVDVVSESRAPLPSNEERANGTPNEVNLKRKETEIVPASTSPSPQSAASNKDRPTATSEDKPQSYPTAAAADKSPSSFKIRMAKFPNEHQAEVEQSSASRGSLRQHELRTIKPYKAPNSAVEPKETERLGNDLEVPGKHYDLIKRAIELSPAGELDANEISHWIMEHYPYYSNKYSFDMCLNSVSATLSQRKKKGDFIKHDPLPSSGNKRCRWSISYRSIEEVEPTQSIKTPDAKGIDSQARTDETPPTGSRLNNSRGPKIPSAQDYHVKANFTESCHIVPSKKDTTRWEDLHSLDAAKYQQHIFRPKDIVVIRPTRDDDPKEFAIIRELKVLEESSSQESDSSKYIAASIFWYQSKSYSLRKAGTGRKLGTDWPEGYDYIRTNILDIVNLGALERKANKSELVKFYQGQKVLDAANSSAKIRENSSKEVAWTLRSPPQKTSNITGNVATSTGRLSRLSFSDPMELDKEKGSASSSVQDSNQYAPQRAMRSREMRPISQTGKEATSTKLRATAGAGAAAAAAAAVERPSLAKQYEQALVNLFEQRRQNAMLKEQMRSEMTRRIEAEETLRAYKVKDMLRQLPLFNQPIDDHGAVRDEQSEMERMLAPSLLDESKWQTFGTLQEALDSYPVSSAPGPPLPFNTLPLAGSKKQSMHGHRRAHYAMQIIENRAQELRAVSGIKLSTAYEILSAHEKELVEEM